MFCDNYEKLLEQLQSRGFTTHSAANGEEAKALVLELIGSCSAGFGGSVTVNSLGIPAALREKGNDIFFHWDEKPENRPATFKKAASADWYVCSTNALTRTAKLVNIDGNGNRVAAMFNGPKNVAIVIGKNKLTDDLESAYKRAKEVACVKNAQRFALKTPCAVSGKCVDCHSPQRLCSVTVVIVQKPKFVEQMHLILVDEELGF